MIAAFLFVRYDGRECGEGEVDPWVGHEVRLELLEVDVERTLEAQRGRRRGHDLGHHPVLVWMAWVSFSHVMRFHFANNPLQLQIQVDPSGQ